MNNDTAISDPRAIKKVIELTPLKVKRIFVTHQFLREHADWNTILQKAHCPYRICSQDRLLSYRIPYTGIVALLESLSFLTFDEFQNKIKGKEHSIIAVFDKITDVGNFSAMIRTAYAGGVDAIIIPKDGATTSIPPSFIKSGGTAFAIPLVKVVNIRRTLLDLKKDGYWIIGTDAGSTTEFWDHQFSAKTVLVVGSEDRGMRSSILDACDFVLKIPTINHIDSLNVSVSFALILYETLRQKRSAKS